MALDDGEPQRLLSWGAVWRHMNGAGILLLLSFNAVVVMLLLATVLFFQCRRGRVASLQRYGKAFYGKELVFHLPDDCPSSLRQYGLVKSRLGTFLLRTWQAVFAVGWIYLVLVAWLAYAPRFYAPAFFVDAFGGWEGLAGPWAVILTEIQVLGMALIYVGDLGSRFMFPVRSMTTASHVIVEEGAPLAAGADPDATKEAPEGRGGCGGPRASSCRTVLRIRKDSDGARRIQYKGARYVHDPDEDAFRPVGFAECSPCEAHAALAAGGHSPSRAREILASCGRNEIHVDMPGVWKALAHEYASFTYIFSMVGIWSYAINSMWFVGVLWFLMTLGTGLAKVLCVVRPNQKERARLAQLTSRCHVLRGGEWVDVQASDIVLRDVVRIDGGASVLPCDGILLEGALVVDESTLSGEPAPVQKLPAERSSTSAAPRSSLAFAGTTCLQSAGPRDGRAVMLATAVGALTARGRLVRASPAPPGVRFKGCDQLPVVYATLGIYAIGLFVVHAFYLNARSWITMYMQLLNIVAMCLNPMLPVSLAMGQSLAAARLRGRWQINCLQPSRIPVAGSVSTMVFDKTGTITEGGMDLDSVIDVQDRCFGRRYKLGGCPSGPSADAGAVGHELPAHARRAMASCHAVEALEDGTLVGSQLEVAMVRASGWQQVAQGVVRSANGKESLEVLRRLRFDDRRALSGAVVRCPRTRESYVYLKGSHEAIQAVATPSSTPSGYAGLAEHCAKDGFYTLGLAMKCLPLNLSSQHIADMPRSSLEANVGVCGLLLFRNEVRPDSSQVFKDLRQGSIRSVICTGDGALTAISVGRRSGVVTTSVVLLGDVRDDTLLWSDPDSGSSWDADAVASSDCQLAVTRPAWRYLRERGALLEPLWTRLVVLARMRPDDKASVVRYLQSRGLVVGMCGDGGNDGGALRAADVGLALSDAAASMPRGLDGLGFSAAGGAESPALVVHLIREGRACLATSLATVQYFVVHALATTGIGTALAIWEGIGLGDFAWLVVDVVIGTLMAAAMTWSGPSDRLGEAMPAASLLGRRTAAAALFPCATALVALAAGFALLWSKGWYRRLNPVADLGLDESQWWLRGDNYDAPVGLVVLLLALATTAFVNTYGGSFRQSVLRNWGVCFLHALVLAVLFWLVLRGPSQFGCVFRVNCDTRHSLLSARELWPLGLLSEGWRLRAASGVGGCFLGAQLLVWQSELAAANYSDPLHGSASGRWLPSKDDDCRPPASHGTAPYGDPLISTLGCEGPNNCYDSRFSYELAAVMVAYVVSNHLFAKGVLQGAFAALARGQSSRATALRGERAEAEAALAEAQARDASARDERVEGVLAQLRARPAEAQELASEASDTSKGAPSGGASAEPARGCAQPASPCGPWALRVEVKDIELRKDERERWGLLATRINPYESAEITTILPGVRGPDPFHRASRKLGCCIFMKRAIW